MTREAGNGVGFARSDAKIATIASGETDSNIVDLGRNYSVLQIKCDDASNIDADTTLGVEIGFDDDDTLADLWASGGSAIFASGTLPTSGTFTFDIPVIGAQRVKIKLDTATSGGAAAFSVYGFGHGINTEYAA